MRRPSARGIVRHRRWRVGAALAVAGAAVGVTLALTAGGNQATTDPARRTTASADCARAIVVLRGNRYVDLGGPAPGKQPSTRLGLIPTDHMRPIGTVRIPPCSDTGSRAKPSWTTQRVASIDGVDPGVAIAGYPRGNVYVRRGAALPPVLAQQPWIRWITQ